MYALDVALAAVLAQASHSPVARLTSLWPDGTVRRAFDLDQRIVTDGKVTAELRQDVRRSASLNLVNADGSLSPALLDDMFASGSLAVVERGALVDGSAVYAPLITGIVTGCLASMSGTLAITLASNMSALRQEAGTALSLVAGTFLVDALHTLWDPVLPNVTWVVEPGADSRALGADIPVLSTDIRLDVGLALADSLGVDAFDDRAGRIVVRLRPDTTRQATARIMAEPLTLDRTIGRTPVNAQGVEGSPGSDAPTYVLVEVDDLASPIHKDRIGLRVAPTIRTDSTGDPDTLRAMGRSQLAEYATAQDSLAVTQHPADIDLDEGDIVERAETISGTSGRWILDQVNYPVCLGTLDTTEVSVAVLFLDAAAA